MTLRHIVAWTFAGDDAGTRAAHAAEVARRLEGLVGVVPSIGTLTVGGNCVGIDGNWDAAVVIDFADEQALRDYLVHPAHEEVAAYIGSVRTARVAVDFEF